MEKLAYGNGDMIQYTRDSQGRVVKQTYEDGAYVDYTYDNSGTVATVYDSESGITSSVCYDLAERPVKYLEEGTNHSVFLLYTYDENNRITRLRENINGYSRLSKFSYDNDDRLTVFQKAYGFREYTYDDFNRVSKTVTKDHETKLLETFYTFKDPTAATTSSQLQSIRNKATGTENAYDKTYTYTYDGNGNITGISEGQKTTTYVYDSANQLIRENNQAEGKTWTWDYDAAGNILSKKTYAYTTEVIGDDVIPADTVNYRYDEDGAWGDLLIEYDGEEIKYDAIGNPERIDGWSFEWKHGRELASMSKGGTTWTHTYNADGLRTKRTNGTTTYTYVYDGGTLVRMTENNNRLFFSHSPDGVPLAVVYKGVEYYYVTNAQGDVIALLDLTGNLAVEYTYDAWGNVLSITGPDADTIGRVNPLRYRGYVYDEETGLYYLQSRYYNPEMGRFVNGDGFVSTGQGLLGNNMFAYCGNNSVCNVDYTGNRYCAATTVSSESSEERGISCRWQKYVKIDNPTILDQWEVSGVKFVPDSSGNGGQIVNSYKISDSFEMAEYARYLMNESEYSSYFSGSVEGFLFEWDVHNIAYRLYTDLGDVTKVNSAKSLDVGRTIYADDHGFFSYAMLRAYEILFPTQAQNDKKIHNALVS